MRKMIIAILVLGVYGHALAMALMCEVSSSYYFGGAWRTETIEYYASNGNCCAPSQGYGTKTIETDYGGGIVSWSSTPYSNSYLASQNPNCTQP